MKDLERKGIERKAANPYLQIVRNAYQTRDVPRMMKQFPHVLIREEGLLSNDTFHVTQALHQYIRETPPGTERNTANQFAKQLSFDLFSGRLPPHPAAFVHLLSIFNDSQQFEEGYALWDWLQDKGEPYLSPLACGAAIELMARAGDKTLPEMENVYADSLKLFPGTFAEYHFSPDAILPNRHELTKIPGLHSGLLQGITTARIRAGDWKKAYLALETALRLFPTQIPKRYFELFMQHRPLDEAYSAFMLACRAGIQVPPPHVTSLINKLTAGIHSSTSVSERVMLVQAITNILFAEKQSGQPLANIHVAAWIRAMGAILPEKAFGEEFVQHELKLRDIIVQTTHEVMSGLFQAGMAPSVHHFGALMSLAGKMRAPDLFATALQDMERIGTELGPSGVRGVLQAAGSLGNKELLEHFWRFIVQDAETKSKLISYEDWVTFARACRRAGHTKFLQLEVLKLQHAIATRTEFQVLQEMDAAETPTPPIPQGSSKFKFMTPEALSSALGKVKATMENIHVVLMSRQPRSIKKSPFQMHLDPSLPPLGTPTALGKAYDQMTTDPHQPPPPPPALDKVRRNRYGTSLADLRYQNWVTIHEMMTLADLHAQQPRIQEPPSTAKKFAPDHLVLIKPSQFPETLEFEGELRERLKLLRSPMATRSGVPVFRKVGGHVPNETLKSLTFVEEEDKWIRPRIIKHDAMSTTNRKWKKVEAKHAQWEAEKPQREAEKAQKMAEREEKEKALAQQIAHKDALMAQGIRFVRFDEQDKSNVVHEGLDPWDRNVEKSSSRE